MADKNIKVYSCGTKVWLKNADTTGFISGICLRYNFVTYEISFVLNGTPYEKWLMEIEFDVDAKKDKDIGFKNI